MIGSVEVQITTPLHPTELSGRVEEAIHNLFPRAEIEDRHGELIAETHSLSRLGDRLEEQNIGPTAREVFLANSSDDTISFDLKKAAAFEGVVNFSVGNPDELGDIHVRVRVEEPDVNTFVDHLVSGKGEADQESPGN